MRATDDSKALPGAVMTWDDYADKQRHILAGGKDAKSSLTPDTPLMLASPKEIYFERRFFVVNGVIVTSSQYRVAGRVEYNDFPDDESASFARKAIERFSPARAFVLDIAGTPGGLRIVEINCFNSAAFYSCNVAKIVEAVESMG